MSARCIQEIEEEIEMKTKGKQEGEEGGESLSRCIGGLHGMALDICVTLTSSVKTVFTNQLRPTCIGHNYAISARISPSLSMRARSLVVAERERDPLPLRSQSAYCVSAMSFWRFAETTSS